MQWDIVIAIKATDNGKFIMDSNDVYYAIDTIDDVKKIIAEDLKIFEETDDETNTSS